MIMLGHSYRWPWDFKRTRCSDLAGRTGRVHGVVVAVTFNAHICDGSFPARQSSETLLELLYEPRIAPDVAREESDVHVAVCC